MTNIGFATLSVIPSMKGVLPALQKQMGAPLEKFGAEAGKTSGGSAAKGFGSSFGKAAKLGFAAVGAIAAAAVTKGFSDAVGAEAGVDKLEASLGITPERAAVLGDAASSVYRDAWGDNLSEVQGYVGNLSTSFEGLGGKQFEDLTPKAIALGDAFDIDVAGGIQTASELVSSGLADSASHAFDLLTTGLQQMPAGIRDELLAASDEYGDFFADLGFTGEQAFGLLTDFAQDGVYGIDKFGDSLKELTIRGTDMSTASVAAYEAAGLSAEEMSAKLAGGGQGAMDAMQQIAAGLSGIEDPLERSNAAIALFGTPLEDLSVAEIPSFLDSLGDVGDGLGDVTGAADKMATKLSSNTKAKTEEFKRKAFGRLADFATATLIPAFESTVQWFEQNWPKIQDVGRQVFGWIQDNVGPIVEAATVLATAAFADMKLWVDENWPRIRDTVAAAVEGIRAAVETVVAVISKIWTRYGEFIVSHLKSSWETAKRLVSAALDVIRGIIQTVTGLLRGEWGQAWDGIKTALAGVWDAMVALIEHGLNAAWQLIQAAWDTVLDITETTWETIKEAIGAAIDAVVRFVTAIPSRIQNTIANLWNGLRSGVDSAKDWVGGRIDLMVGFVTGIPGRIRYVLAGLWAPLRSSISPSGHLGPVHQRVLRRRARRSHALQAPRCRPASPPLDHAVRRPAAVSRMPHVRDKGILRCRSEPLHVATPPMRTLQSTKPPSTRRNLVHDIGDVARRTLHAVLLARHRRRQTAPDRSHPRLADTRVRRVHSRHRSPCGQRPASAIDQLI
ncbi:MAG: hypothetical protein AAGF73_08985 [Actinomycetota bacterium]